MDALAKVAAAEADLLSSEKQEKEKKSGSKNKKRGVIKVVEDLYYVICVWLFRLLSCKNESGLYGVTENFNQHVYWYRAECQTVSASSLDEKLGFASW